MKKKLVLIIVLLFALVLTACNTIIGAITETTVKITGPNTITIGETVQLYATITPESKAEGGVTWRSNNTNIATITSDGVLTGVSGGRVSISATAVSDDKAIEKYGLNNRTLYQKQKAWKKSHRSGHPQPLPQQVCRYRKDPRRLSYPGHSSTQIRFSCRYCRRQ